MATPSLFFAAKARRRVPYSYHHDELLELALTEFLEAEESGRPMDVAELVARYPEIAGELVAFIEAHGRMAKLAEPLRQSVEYLVQRWEAAAGVAPDERTIDYRDGLPPDPNESGTVAQSHLAGRFGDYELLEELGRGGMGVVFKARHTRLQRIVALKMVLAGRFADAAELGRFREEALTAAKLDHPGIVPIYEAGEVDGLPYYAMGFVEGISLADRLRQGALPPAEAVRLVRRVTAAVAYAHSHGVIHRDLKPANILLATSAADGRLEPRITDFGLARRLDGDDRLTTTGQVLGTPSYMPPEQAAGRPHAAGAASDVFSLGAILYALLAGRPPFVANSPMEVLLQVLEKDPPSLRSLNPAVPRELEWICLKCLEKEETDRYESAAALGEDLDRYLRQEPPEARAGSLWQGLRRWVRREPVFTAHLGGLGIVILLAQVVFVLHHEREAMYHLRVCGLLSAWLIASWGIREISRRRSEPLDGRADWSPLVWTAADVGFLTGLLGLLVQPLGLLFGAYHVLICGAGLYFRTRLVAVTTLLAMAGSGLILVARHAETEPWHYVLFLEATLVLTGILVGYHVWRLGILREYYEERKPRW
jgi:serine/threonine-protein kinase